MTNHRSRITGVAFALVTALAISNAWGGTVMFAPIGDTSVLRNATEITSRLDRSTRMPVSACGE